MPWSLSVSVCWLSASLPRSLEDSSSLPTSHVLWLQNQNSSYWTNLKAALTSKLNVIDQLTSSGLGVILNTHFPAHALARAASGILVPQGKPPIFGTAAELFSEAKLSALFGIDVRIRTLDFDGRQTPVVAAVS